jgi:methylmalonyl-CoA epimerase
VKAWLDHVGIAVRDVAEALAFYRDALGLEVEGTEDVSSQRVRAHFVRAGESALELLEGTAADSPITKYVEKRGPGLHHVTLRVEDITAALAHLKSRGVRLIDEHPRPGAEGATVAFIHPSAAHGVLVELKQAGRHPLVTAAAPVATPARGSAERAPSFVPPDVGAQRIQRFTVGDLELVSLYDGFLRLDGGSMFGVVPRTLWAARVPSDDRNRILLAMRPLLVRGERTVLIDAGLGDKDEARFRDIYGVERSRHLDHALAEAGVSPEEVDIVIATHLHFDHVGGFTVRDGTGHVRPRFPRARYVVRRGEWDDATTANERTRASYLRDNFAPLAEAGLLELVDADRAIAPGIRLERTAGHTAHHQSVWIESAGRQAVFAGDLVPTVAHVPEPWIMGYDLYPLETLASKKRFLSAVEAVDALVFFEHDPSVAAARLRSAAGTRVVTPEPANL